MRLSAGLGEDTEEVDVLSAAPTPHKGNGGACPACLVLSLTGALQVAFPKLRQALNLPQEQEASIH